MHQRLSIGTALAVFPTIYALNIASSSSKQEPGTDSKYCTSNKGIACDTRYLLFDTSLYAGFNLCLDVYIRIANLVRFLNEDPASQSWVLVLPPWTELRHWKISQSRMPWRSFFNVKSMNEYIPVIEHEEFIKRNDGQIIDEVYYLQDYENNTDFWRQPQWEEKMDFDTCRLQYHKFFQDSDGLWISWFWGYEDTRARHFKCLSVQAPAVSMRHFLMHNTTGRSVAFVQAEQLRDGEHGPWNATWWSARRSLRYADHLRYLTIYQREKKLSSYEASDRTVLAKSWKTTRREHGDAFGGPYLAVHLRRRGDYVKEYKYQIPGIKSAADQVKQVLVKYRLNMVFVATDTSKGEFEEFEKYLPQYHVRLLGPTAELISQVKDGGIAIIEQLICANARVFIGSYRSTFIYRIQEEREIMGFHTKTTYLQLCVENDPECQHERQWQIVYE